MFFNPGQKTTPGYVGVQMVMECPTDPRLNVSKEVRQKCSSASNMTQQQTDLTLIDLTIPVTTFSSNVTYANIYCAQCHGEEENHYEFWDAEIRNVSTCYQNALIASIVKGIQLTGLDDSLNCTPLFLGQRKE